MTDSFINGIAYYLPSGILSNEDINKNFPEWDAEKISNKTGINVRHIARVDEFASDMAFEAAQKLFNEYHINKNSIDFLIFCTQSPDYFLPSTSCVLQDRLDLNTSIGSLDINQGCSGYIYGLSLAKGLISSGMANNVLLLTSETYSKYIHPQDKSNITIFGDAATATLISNTEGLWRLHDFVWGTNGKGAENLILENGGIRNRYKKGEDIFDESGHFIRNDDYLYMNGGEIFNFSSKTVPKLVVNILEKNSILFDEVDAFVLHQANKYMLDYIRRKLGIELQKFIYHLDGVGNTVSNTIPISLKEKCECIDYNTILLAGFGVGYSWGGCILKKV